jgi:hypothetical protein
MNEAVDGWRIPPTISCASLQREEPFLWDRIKHRGQCLAELLQAMCRHKIDSGPLSLDASYSRQVSRPLISGRNLPDYVSLETRQ